MHLNGTTWNKCLVVKTNTSSLLMSLINAVSHFMWMNTDWLKKSIENSTDKTNDRRRNTITTNRMMIKTVLPADLTCITLHLVYTVYAPYTNIKYSKHWIGDHVYHTYPTGFEIFQSWFREVYSYQLTAFCRTVRFLPHFPTLFNTTIMKWMPSVLGIVALQHKTGFLNLNFIILLSSKHSIRGFSVIS